MNYKGNNTPSRGTAEQPNVQIFMSQQIVGQWIKMAVAPTWFI